MSKTETRTAGSSMTSGGRSQKQSGQDDYIWNLGMRETRKPKLRVKMTGIEFYHLSDG